MTRSANCWLYLDSPRERGLKGNCTIYQIGTYGFPAGAGVKGYPPRSGCGAYRIPRGSGG